MTHNIVLISPVLSHITCINFIERDLFFEINIETDHVKHKCKTATQL